MNRQGGYTTGRGRYAQGENFRDTTTGSGGTSGSTSGSTSTSTDDSHGTEQSSTSVLEGANRGGTGNANVERFQSDFGIDRTINGGGVTTAQRTKVLQAFPYGDGVNDKWRPDNNCADIAENTARAANVAGIVPKGADGKDLSYLVHLEKPGYEYEKDAEGHSTGKVKMREVDGKSVPVLTTDRHAINVIGVADETGRHIGYQAFDAQSDLAGPVKPSLQDAVNAPEFREKLTAGYGPVDQSHLAGGASNVWTITDNDTAPIRHASQGKDWTHAEDGTVADGSGSTIRQAVAKEGSFSWYGKDAYGDNVGTTVAQQSTTGASTVDGSSGVPNASATGSFEIADNPSDYTESTMPWVTDNTSYGGSNWETTSTTTSTTDSGSEQNSGRLFAQSDYQSYDDPYGGSISSTDFDSTTLGSGGLTE